MAYPSLFVGGSAKLNFLIGWILEKEESFLLSSSSKIPTCARLQVLID